ncbi:MAG: DUF1343 domain-containing protein [Gammaproteobacteria bacterium]
MTVQTGLDRIETAWPNQYQKARVGLLSHPASINQHYQHAVPLFAQAKFCQLTTLFGPQHGIHGQTQDNMIEWEGFIDPLTQLPVYSLYGQARKPTSAMLNNLDIMVVDLQDVGARYYTFIWTLELCMQACLDAGKAMVVLDRPNPINGLQLEGNILEPTFASFVGQRPLPMRHGMTIGEIARYLQGEFYPTLQLEVITLQQWQRADAFEQTGLPWVMPSPNMPTVDTAYVYPGMCLFEGTEISEGRGTTRPFEIFGAPYIDPEQLLQDASIQQLPGVVFRPLYFQPTFQKYQGKICGGAQMHVTDRVKFNAVTTAITLLKTIHDLYPEEFAWKQPPYEYEFEKLPIDILAGSTALRETIEAGKSLIALEQAWQLQRQQFADVRQKYLLYA